MTWKDFVLITLFSVVVLMLNNAAWFLFVQRSYPTMTTYVQQVGMQVGRVILEDLKKQGVTPAPSKPVK